MQGCSVIGGWAQDDSPKVSGHSFGVSVAVYLSRGINASNNGKLTWSMLRVATNNIAWYLLDNAVLTGRVKRSGRSLSCLKSTESKSQLGTK